MSFPRKTRTAQKIDVGLLTVQMTQDMGLTPQLAGLFDGHAAYMSRSKTISREEAERSLEQVYHATAFAISGRVP